MIYCRSCHVKSCHTPPRRARSHLRHDRDGAAQAVLRHGAHVHTVHTHAALLHVVKAQQQPQHRRLAAAGGPHHGERAAAWGRVTHKVVSVVPTTACVWLPVRRGRGGGARSEGQGVRATAQSERGLIETLCPRGPPRAHCSSLHGQVWEGHRLA
eukprot:363944-Chlamydomonas_euryale.AAC.2